MQDTSKLPIVTIVVLIVIALVVAYAASYSTLRRVSAWSARQTVKCSCVAMSTTATTPSQ